MGLEQEKEDAMAMVWGTGEEKAKARSSKKEKAADGTDLEFVKGKSGGKRKRGADDDVEFDSDDEANKPKKKTKFQKQQAATAANEKCRSLHMHIDNTTTRNDLRTLFEDYDPKVTIEKYQNPKKKGQYAIVVFKTEAMSDYALERFNKTDQKELLNVEELVMTRIMSRRQNKRKTEKTGKVKRAVSKGKWEAAKKAAREAAEE